MRVSKQVKCVCGVVVEIGDGDFVDMAKTPVGLVGAGAAPYTRDYRHRCKCGHFHFFSEAATVAEFEEWRQYTAANQTQLHVVEGAGGPT